MKQKPKRKLFDELVEGVDAMQQQREGKITLRSHEIEDLPPLEVDADLIRDTRERMLGFPLRNRADWIEVGRSRAPSSRQAWTKRSCARTSCEPHIVVAAKTAF